MDTIAAISTPIGEGGIAIVRVSGDEAISIVDKVFLGKKLLREVKSHTIHYGKIKSPKDGEIIDEALVTVMRAPHTFTREDVVEVNVHGGIVSVTRVLDSILEAGARMAEPGEFTKRAFLNGRIDLTQAEAVIDLIRSKSDKAARASLSQLEGSLSQEIRKARQILIELMAHIEVTIDYPEHDVEEVTYAQIENKLKEALDVIKHLEERGREGKILREGVETAIIGKPNVGKSSLLNALTRQAKAIVTDIPGTTRDVVEEYVNVRGIPLKLMDTAGIRKTEDVVEKIGVEKSKEIIRRAELILMMVNQGEPLEEIDYDLFAMVKGKNVILLLNKADLPERVRIEEIRNYFPKEPIVKLSILRGEGLEELEKAIANLFFKGGISRNDETFMLNSRHLHLIRTGRKALEDALHSSRERLPYDMIEIDLKRGWSTLGEIIGETAGEEIISQIFSQFCLGK
ncbi:tRNA uridine-5-carboxymethylaminomethyl(34) synthesis GTPase MnmE [Thermicanus aegyptius]|uniref:tRNA uridine-5-carboxymethylaminomethyl(34) synthesis GTPase MnmE n=1 Tax=Thermicanus aegyptius TaxID=94009 RepID=UPI00048D680E|nr:tRNA uridine-5-carboxymethylaminomethyl(34) synthesis GTPase MnmE [Thermicanus aegyptius]